MAQDCLINNGYTLGCSSIGGVEKLWLGTYSADSLYTLDANDVITGVTSGATVFLFEQDMEYAGLNQEGQFARENGTVHFSSVVSAKFIELDYELRNTMLALSKAPLVAVVKTNSGQFFFLGLESAGRATSGVLSAGVAMGDLNGATLEVTFKSKNGAFLIEESLIGTSIAVG